MPQGRFAPLPRLVLASLLLLLAACARMPAPPLLVNLAITPQFTSLDAGQSVQLRVIGHFDDGKTADLTDFVQWGQGNPGVATITAQGRVTAVGGGEATVTATWDGVTTSLSFSVPYEWSGQALLSVPRDGAAIVQEGNSYEVLVIGGTRHANGVATPTRALDRYLPASHAWLAGPDIPADCGQPLVAPIADSSFMVVCGDSAWRYSVPLQAWQALEAPAANHAGGALLGGYGYTWYLIGGSTTTLVERYDGYSGHWTPVGNLSQLRSDFAASTASDYATAWQKIVVSGGSVPSGPYNLPVSVDTVDIYDIDNATWSTSHLPTPRSGHAQVDTGGGALAIGGVTYALGASPDLQVATPLASSEEISSSTLAWSARPAMATARHHFAVTRGPMGSWRVFGGAGSSGVLAGAESYFVLGQTWSALPSLTGARAHAAALWLNDGSTLVVGGRDADGNSLATVEVLQ